MILKNLPPDTREEDVVNSLTGFYGVKSITKDGLEAIIEFDQPWQTKKPIQQGLVIRKTVSMIERYDMNRRFIHSCSIVIYEVFVRTYK